MGPIHATSTSPAIPWPSASVRREESAAASPAAEPPLTLDLSPEAQAQLQRSEGEVRPSEPTQSSEAEQAEDTEQAEEAERAKEAEQAEEAQSPDGLSSEERAQVKAMAARDAEVRAHEQAHKAVGGALTGSITYTTEKGPDGKDYAIGGHVPIDVSPGRSPEETVQKAARIQAAALAPADPSPADKSVAAKAAQMASDARVAAADQARAESEAAREAEAEQKAATDAAQAAEEADPAQGPDTAAPKAARAAAAYAKWAT